MSAEAGHPFPGSTSASSTSQAEGSARTADARNINTSQSSGPVAGIHTSVTGATNNNGNSSLSSLALLSEPRTPNAHGRDGGSSSSHSHAHTLNHPQLSGHLASPSSVAQLNKLHSQQQNQSGSAGDGSGVGGTGRQHHRTPMSPPLCNFVDGLLTETAGLLMAYAHWKNHHHDKIAVFDLFFRVHPFNGEFTIFCGLEEVLRFIQNWELRDEDIGLLQRKFAEWDAGFFQWLRCVDMSQVKLYAVKEGSVVFPRLPLIRVEGPLGICQLLESTLLVLVNYASLVATNAARHRLAVGPSKTLLEFGLRRAQGPDGAMSASRYAYMGGFDGTSNVKAAALFGMDMRGTHAHSFVVSFYSLSDIKDKQMMDAKKSVKRDFVSAVLGYRQELKRMHSHEGELTAFISYAQAFPNGFLGLLDTFDTLESGIWNFVCVALALHEFGYRPVGIRLDSGDLAYLSRECRKIFVRMGEQYSIDYFAKLTIVASNDLSEKVLYALKEQGHEIDTFGVGTNLVTCFPEVDTRVLTSAGFKFLDELESAETAFQQGTGPQPLYACYDQASKQVVYRPGTIVLPDRVPSHIIDFTPSESRKFWEHPPSPMSPATNHLSLRVTSNHGMYVQVGDFNGGSVKLASRNSETIPFRVVPAGELASDHSCRCPSSRKLDGPINDQVPRGRECLHGHSVVQFSACAESGFQSADNSWQSAVASLGLQSAAQYAALAEALGYWFTPGVIQLAHGLNVCLQASKDGDWLTALLLQMGLQASVDFARSRFPADASERIQISNPAWCAFFQRNFSVQVHSSKIPDWVFQLPKDMAQLLLRGVVASQRATGTHKASSIRTSSEQFRDSILRLCLHAGYAARFSLVEDRKEPTSQAVEWEVSFGPETASTLLLRTSDVTRTPLDIKGDGRIWCVEVQHHDHLIFAQRALRDPRTGTVVQASTPIIVANCKNQPALGCVYKLVEVDHQPRMKVSADVDKVTIPGEKEAYRLYNQTDEPVLDLLVQVGTSVPQCNKRILCRHPFDANKRVYVTPARVEPLHQLFWDGMAHFGKVNVLEGYPSLKQIREFVSVQLGQFREDHLRRLNPTPYKLSVSSDLFSFMSDLWQQETPIAEII